MNTQRQRELALLRAERERLSRDLDRIDVEMGRRADEILNTQEFVSKSAIGRLLGFSHTHVGTLIERARAVPESVVNDRIPVMENTIAGEYVSSIGAHVVRSISGFTPSDVLAQSGLDPRLFAEENRQSIHIPNMLWQLDTGDWIGIEDVSVGYGGTGPRLARDALVRAGVAESTASQIPRWRFCDAVDVDNPDSWLTSVRWPVHGRSTPLILDDRMIVLFGDRFNMLRYDWEEPKRRGSEIDETGIMPSDHPDTPLQSWLRFLDDADELPAWAQGSRVARVFRNDDAAAADGFTITSGLWGALRGQTIHPSIVIEQGNVQLWGAFYRPHDTTQYLPEEAYEALAMASVYPAPLAARDERAARPWGRFVSTFFNIRDGLPDIIDISADATTELSYAPSEAIRY